MWALSHLLVSFSSGAYPLPSQRSSVLAHRDGLHGSPNTLYKLKTAASSMAGVRNAQKKNKMLLCGFYLICLQGKGMMVFTER